MTAPPEPEALAVLLGEAPVADLRRLLGGASREMWSFRVGGRRMVLRRDPPGAPSRLGAQGEARLLRAAAGAGMAVPAVVADAPGQLVLSWVEGETLARRILRDDAYARARERLLQQCAEQLARLHTGVRPEQVPGLAAPDVVTDVRARLDAIGEPHPAFELALSWLTATRPPVRTDIVLHGDFRLGNLMVDREGLAAVLDWELAHLGDPHQDLAWMCVRSWRFGSPLPAAGLGTREQLRHAYARAGGMPLDAVALHWWEVYCTLDWGVMCLQQAHAHLSGAVRSVELAAIGRRCCEVELDVLDLLPGACSAPPPDPDPQAAHGAGPHDRPSASELLEAVGEFLAGAELSEHDRYLAKVSARLLHTVERELLLGPALAAAHTARLAALGVQDDAALAAQIRSGDLRHEQALATVRAAVVDKLRVADPRQLSGRTPAPPPPSPVHLPVPAPILST